MAAAEQQVALPRRYRVVRHIANGGMASVWAAEDSLLERLVAVKVLAPGYAADPHARRRFTREARAAARVSDHPNVVTIYDIGEHDDKAFIVMEHFAGGTVSDRLKRREPVPVPDGLRWLRETAAALDTAHAAEIVHRDVKPGNLLLDEHGRLAVGDFGIASLAGETQMTLAGQILGTAAYLSPEQARGQPATPASDRYSLAVVAYELLCGRRPFDGDTPAAQARAHVDMPPPIPWGPCAAAGETLAQGLDKDPERRPRTAAALVDQLEAALHAPTPLGSPTNPVGRRRSSARAPLPPQLEGGMQTMPQILQPATRRRTSRGRGWSLAGLVVLCVAAGAGAALIADDGHDGSRDSAGSTPSAQLSAPATAVQPRQPVPAGGAGPVHGPGKDKGKGKGKGKGEGKAHGKDKGKGEAKGKAEGKGKGTTPAAPTSGSDGRSPQQLNNAGYAMLPGRPADAVPLLQAAVAGFESQGATGDLTYAYALYNLGWALRLAGHPAEALPYLEKRLQISDDRRAVVQRELRTARQEADAG